MNVSKKNHFNGSLKKQIIYFFCFIIFCFSMTSAFEPFDNDFIAKDQEESLFLRRIIEFWEEGKKVIVKKEIEKYLSNNSQDQFFDYLCALLGNIYLTEENTKNAVMNYAVIKNNDIKEKVFVNYIQSLYQLKDYKKICSECSLFSNFIESRDKDICLRFCYILGDSYYNLSLKEKGDLKLSLAHTAKSHLEKILKSQYENEVIELLANIALILKDYKESSSLYCLLAKKFPQNKSKYLFQAANIQVKYDKNMALKTFSQVCYLGKEQANEAAYNKLLLLIEKNLYSELILSKNQLSALILKKKQKELLNFYLAKSYFILGQYPTAITLLEVFLERYEKSNNNKNVLSMLVSCSEKTDNISIMDRVIDRYEKLYPEDKELAKIYFTRAIYHKKKENYQKAKKDFETIEKRFQNFNDENYFIEAAHLFYKSKNYLKSRLCFKRFIENNQNSEILPVCWNYFINSSIKVVEMVPDNKKVAAKNVLIKDLENYLTQAKFSSEKEEIKYRTLLVQLKYELGIFDEALTEGLNVYNKFEQTKNDPDLNLLIALCYKNKNKKNLFCQYAERALFLDKNKTLDTKNIRFCLYNTYIQLNEKKTDNSDKLLSKAADNLLLILDIKDGEIDTQNMLWLIDYFYTPVNNYMKKNWKNSLEKNKELLLSANKSIKALEKLLTKNLNFLKKDKPLISDKKDIFLEEQILKLSDLYEYTNKWELKKELLHGLEKSYQKEKNFKFQEITYFKLAKMYQEKENENEAKKYFQKDINLHQRSYYNLASNLFLIRLEVSSINKEQFNMSNEKIIEILSLLKNLKLQKKLKNEPLHLEAALDYCNIQYKTENDLEKKLKLLMQVKQDFSSSSDIISKDYQNSRKKYPFKDKILKAYLMFIDAEISFIKFNLFKDKQQIIRAKEILQIMQQKNYIMTEYLENNIKHLINEMKNINYEKRKK